MAVTGLSINRRGLAAGGCAFEPVGPYERICGTVRFAVDPEQPANANIVDLPLAPRAADGRVHFDADFALLQPLEPERGSGRLLFDVLNRGQQRALVVFNDGSGEPYGEQEPDLGNGFLMRQGYTVAWCGWQQDVPTHLGLRMALRGPEVGRADIQREDLYREPESPLGGGDSRPLANRMPVRGPVLCEFQPSQTGQVLLLSDLDHRPYPAADVNDPHAILTVREATEAPRRPIARELWAFARIQHGRVVPDPEYVYLSTGFQAGKIYEIVYSAIGARVVGLGLLAVRDVVAWLRYGDGGADNPGGTSIRYAYGFGRSQSGRFLRHFLYLGLNEDEQERAVFDGLIPLVAGARRGEFNVRFGQPSKTLAHGVGALFPFSDGVQTDPLTGQTDALVRRLGRLGAGVAGRTSATERTALSPDASFANPRVPPAPDPQSPAPRILTFNSSAEYWGGDRGSGGQASLLHTDVEGTRDVDLPETSRVYLMAGTQHVSGHLPLTHLMASGLRARYPLNSLDYGPLMRAALMNLDRWVSAGEEPPPSEHPRLDKGSAVPPEAALARLKAILNVRVPAHPPQLRRRLGAGAIESTSVVGEAVLLMGVGPDERLGAAAVVRTPVGAETALSLAVGPADPYHHLVSSVDADGNEVAGIRLPDIAVPLATYTGWNLRHPDIGAPDDLLPMAGATFPLARSAAERQASGDPRPAIQERYRSREDYLERIRQAAAGLVAERYLLAEDVEPIVGRAARLYDLLTAMPAIDEEGSA